VQAPADQRPHLVLANPARDAQVRGAGIIRGGQRPVRTVRQNPSIA
jgi:hypothetical protein